MEEQESTLWADEKTTSILAACEQGAISDVQMTRGLCSASAAGVTPRRLVYVQGLPRPPTAHCSKAQMARSHLIVQNRDDVQSRRGPLLGLAAN
jgi:hypothetical protein